MQRQVVYGRWIEIDGEKGIAAVLFDDVFTSQNSKTFTPSKSDVADYYHGRKIYDISIRDGWGARLSAPSYMDCTEWVVYDSENEVTAALEDMYGDN